MLSLGLVSISKDPIREASTYPAQVGRNNTDWWTVATQGNRCVLRGSFCIQLSPGKGNQGWGGNSPIT